MIAALKLVAELLALVKIANARSLYSGNVNENVVGPVIGLDEAVALLGVEPFHSSGSHRKPFSRIWPACAFACRVNHRHLTESGSALCASYEMRAEPKVDSPDVALLPCITREARRDALATERRLEKPPSESATQRTRSPCSKGENDERHHER